MNIFFSIACKYELKYFNHGLPVRALFSCYVPFTYLFKYKQ